MLPGEVEHPFFTGRCGRKSMFSHVVSFDTLGNEDLITSVCGVILVLPTHGAGLASLLLNGGESSSFCLSLL